MSSAPLRAGSSSVTGQGKLMLHPRDVSVEKEQCRQGKSCSRFGSHPSDSSEPLRDAVRTSRDRRAHVDRALRTARRQTAPLNSQSQFDRVDVSVYLMVPVSPANGFFLRGINA